jgi:toxin ParE1/3/4
VAASAKVILGPHSLADLISIFDYVAADNPDRATELIERLIQKITSLEEFPLLGKVPKDSQLRAKGYRVLVVDDYLIFYAVKGQAVRIKRVLHGARDYASLIEEAG